jgi:methyl-accepting chemotaxis protein
MRAQFTNSPTINGELVDNHVVAYTKIEYSDWVVLKHAPANNAFALCQDIQQGILIFVTIALVGVVLISGTIGRNTANAISDLSKKASALEEGDLDVDIESSRRDEIGQLYETFDTMRAALKERIQEVEVARTEAEKEPKNAEEQREQLQSAADRYNETMAKCADGDLTQRLEPDENNDAMREIAEEFNYMIDQIEGTIAQVKQFSGKVGDTSSIVLESTSELKDASGQIAESAQVISEETEDVQNDLEILTEQLEDCLDRLDAGDDSAVTDLETLADDVPDLAERTSEALNESENIAAATEQQTVALSEVTETARDLDRSAGPLADLLDNFKSSEDQAFNFGEDSGVDRTADDS